MNKNLRGALQDRLDDKIRKERKGHTFISKGDSLFQCARKFGLATDMPYMNRDSRRKGLKDAIIQERDKRRKEATE